MSQFILVLGRRRTDDFRINQSKGKGNKNFVRFKGTFSNKKYGKLTNIRKMFAIDFRLGAVGCCRPLYMSVTSEICRYGSSFGCYFNKARQMNGALIAWPLVAYCTLATCIYPLTNCQVCFHPEMSGNKLKVNESLT